LILDYDNNFAFLKPNIKDILYPCIVILQKSCWPYIKGMVWKRRKNI